MLEIVPVRLILSCFHLNSEDGIQKYQPLAPDPF
jgi:hypothetical protein